MYPGDRNWLKCSQIPKMFEPDQYIVSNFYCFSPPGPDPTTDGPSVLNPMAPVFQVPVAPGVNHPTLEESPAPEDSDPATLMDSD